LLPVNFPLLFIIQGWNRDAHKGLKEEGGGKVKICPLLLKKGAWHNSIWHQHRQSEKYFSHLDIVVIAAKKEKLYAPVINPTHLNQLQM